MLGACSVHVLEEICTDLPILLEYLLLWHDSSIKHHQGVGELQAPTSHLLSHLRIAEIHVSLVFRKLGSMHVRKVSYHRLIRDDTSSYT